MLTHCVFMKTKAHVRPDEVRAVITELGDFAGSLDGVLSFHGGANLDFENKTPDHPYGFVIQFRDRAALLAYDRNPRHRVLGQRLVDLCVGGAEGIRVYDIAEDQHGVG